MSCSSLSRRSDSDATAKAAAEASAQATAQAQNTELRSVIQSLNSRLESMEGKLSEVNQKLDAVGRPPLFDPKSPKLTGVRSHPSDTAGDRVESRASDADPDIGFVNDDAVSSYRQAMVGFRAARYSDAVLAFSSFIEKFADHPLAGAAQYHLGEAYFRQNEYQLALQEFQRVLTSYDHSSHVADALREMALAADRLRRPQDAARYRQQLMSMFPQSPAAEAVAQRDEVPKSEPSPQATFPTSATTSGSAGGVDPAPSSSPGSRAPQSLRAVTGSSSPLDQPPPTAPAPVTPGGQDQAE